MAGVRDAVALEETLAMGTNLQGNTTPYKKKEGKEGEDEEREERKEGEEGEEREERKEGKEGEEGKEEGEDWEESKKKKNEKREYRLANYEELPDYMKENEFIRKYYRSEWPISHALLSLFSWHNETLNVWTHLLGFLLFLGLTSMHLREMPQVADLLSHLHGSFTSNIVENVSLFKGDLFRMASPSSCFDCIPGISFVQHLAPRPSAPRWPFLVFLSGSMFCLLTSSVSHLFCCHSRQLNLLLNRLDYAGIAVMITASFFPPVYYAFLCAPHWRILYLSAISLLAFVAVLSLLAPAATSGSHRSFRAILFTATGLTGIIPAVHIAAANWSEAKRIETVSWEVAMSALYLAGTMFYASRVPERWRPGRFDIVGHSHQIFHLFVVAGAMAHYAAALLFLQWRDEVGCHV